MVKLFYILVNTDIGMFSLEDSHIVSGARGAG
jgi:hypothetical protein